MSSWNLAQVPTAVIRFPGTNCERETVRVLSDVLGQHPDLLWYADEQTLDRYAAVILPGGFSYGDHLRAGALARFAPIMRSVEAFASRGGLVMGICNGFQILLEAGLLPGAMIQNASGRFRSDWVYCRVEQNSSPFTRLCEPGQVLHLPIAHHEGNYQAESAEALAEIESRGQVVLRYCELDGKVSASANPNGSSGNIAGVMNAAGTVMGLMPHPERACEALLGSTDGQFLFASLLASAVRAVV